MYYKEVGSSAQPRRVPYSNTVPITQLQPNTEYNITYVTGNGLGVNRAEVRQFTLPTGEGTHLKFSVWVLGLVHACIGMCVCVCVCVCECVCV